MSQAKGRAIVYLRRSSSKQENSLEDQLAWAIKEAKERHLELDATQAALKKCLKEGSNNANDLYLDNAISGADMNRPGFLLFHQRATTDREVTHAMFWARDRFARPEQAEKAVSLEKDILLNGTATVVSNGSCFEGRTRMADRQAEDIQLYLEYSTAGRYRPELASKVLRAAARNAEKGYSTGGRAPYGFVRALMNEVTGEIEEFLPDGKRVSGDHFRVVLVPGQDEESQRKLEVVRRIAGD